MLFLCFCLIALVVTMTCGEDSRGRRRGTRRGITSRTSSTQTRTWRVCRLRWYLATRRMLSGSSLTRASSAHRRTSLLTAATSTGLLLTSLPPTPVMGCYVYCICYWTGGYKVKTKQVHSGCRLLTDTLDLILPPKCPLGTWSNPLEKVQYSQSMTDPLCS